MKNTQTKLTSLGLAVLYPRYFLGCFIPTTKSLSKRQRRFGVVKFDGAVPTLPALQITKYKEICKDVPNETLSIGPGQGIRFAVVTLEGITKGKAVEKEIVHELDNINCRFTPRVQAASIGQFVLFKNSDPSSIRHMRFLRTSSRNSMSDFILGVRAENP